MASAGNSYDNAAARLCFLTYLVSLRQEADQSDREEKKKVPLAPLRRLRRQPTYHFAQKPFFPPCINSGKLFEMTTTPVN
jgi:hypothetical protein